MRYLVLLAIWFFPLYASAQDWEDRQVFQSKTAGQALRIISSTDTSLFAPIIEEFLLQRSDVTIEYLVTSTAELNKFVRQTPDQYDLVISSAMDLQLKLANDGFALRLDGVEHPDWAQWRKNLFAFTTEPAAIVINRAAFAGQTIPQTRQELIQALRAAPNRFRGKIGTYDVRQSGLGYLFATQDARASESFWRLTEVMGSLDARLYCCSGAMIDDLENGTITVAYNVLGSYASARRDTHDTLQIILPSDFPTTMMRTAFVAKSTLHPKTATDFIEHLIASQSNAANEKGSLLPPLDLIHDIDRQATIALEPALITYLDALKRRTFLREWENAIIQQR